jgi:hypothetical protein
VPPCGGPPAAGTMRKAGKFVQGRVFRRAFRAVPKGWFSHDFDVFDPAGTRVATADLSDWSENAELEVRGTRYMARHQTLAQQFSLEEEDGLRLAVAEKPSAWRETFSLEHGGERYELKRESPWRRSFVLSRVGAGAVGSIRQKSVFGR